MISEKGAINRSTCVGQITREMSRNIDISQPWLLSSFIDCYVSHVTHTRNSQ